MISKTAYLAGVPKQFFENEYEPPDLAVCQELEECKPARIVRSLCILRTEVMHRFKLQQSKKSGQRDTYTLSDLVPTDAIDRLYQDGVSPMIAFHRPAECLAEIERLIAAHIDNCRSIFPLWVRWEYIRDLFLMPDGLTEKGIKAAVALYQKQRALYPYQMYINWQPVSEGNILFSDMKFVVLLYRWHGEEFKDLGRVSDTGRQTKGSVRGFLAESKKAVIVVDCENSDPYKLCAALRDLERDVLERVSKITLYDDSHSASAWRILSSYIDCPVEHSMIDRVKKQKSLVDISLTAGACREFYQNGVDSFILVSSDSDYWGLISSLPDARFLVMAEREHVSGDLKATMDAAGISYCFLEDFCSGDSGGIQTDALLREMHGYLGRSVQLNVNTMMEHALHATRIELSEVERQQFYDKYIRQMYLVIGEDGAVEIRLLDK